jgi:hypothetical protein
MLEDEREGAMMLFRVFLCFYSFSEVFGGVLCLGIRMENRRMFDGGMKEAVRRGNRLEMFGASMT